MNLRKSPATNSRRSLQGASLRGGANGGAGIDWEADDLRVPLIDRQGNLIAVIKERDPAMVAHVQTQIRINVVCLRAASNTCVTFHRKP